MLYTGRPSAVPMIPRSSFRRTTALFTCRFFVERKDRKRARERRNVKSETESERQREMKQSEGHSK